MLCELLFSLIYDAVMQSLEAKKGGGGGGGGGGSRYVLTSVNFLFFEKTSTLSTAEAEADPRGTRDEKGAAGCFLF